MTTAPPLHVSSRLRRGMNRVLECDDAFFCNSAHATTGDLRRDHFSALLHVN